MPARSRRPAHNLVTPDYFRTMRIPLLKGRDFTDRDDLQAPLVAVINQTFARANGPAKIRSANAFTVPPTARSAHGHRRRRRREASAAQPSRRCRSSMLAHYQVPMIFSCLVARTALPPDEAWPTTCGSAIWSVDKDQPVWAVRSLDEQVEATQGPTRFLALAARACSRSWRCCSPALASTA